MSSITNGFERTVAMVAGIDSFVQAILTFLLTCPSGHSNR